MSVIGTYNGASIIGLPGGVSGTSAFRSVVFSMTDSVAVTTSPFSLLSSYYTWPGGDLWTAQVTLPPMKRINADAWICFLAELRGKANCFLLGDPEKQAPRGTALGTPVVTGTNLAGSQTLNTAGWTHSSAGVLVTGDYIGLSSSSGATRLHVVLENVSSNSSGDATINIWPSLRETPSGFLTLINPVGMFKLADNSRQYSADIGGIVSLSFKCAEFR
jgi:hypothetical protein